MGEHHTWKLTLSIWVPPQSFIMITQCVIFTTFKCLKGPGGHTRSQLQASTQSFISQGKRALALPCAPGEVTPCQIKNHVQRKFATPILYAIDIFKNYDFFSLNT
jgi:hypothetical protein